MTQEQKENFLAELAKLHERYERSKVVEPDYFEPGMMEYLDQWEGGVRRIHRTGPPSL